MGKRLREPQIGSQILEGLGLTTLEMLNASHRLARTVNAEQ